MAWGLGRGGHGQRHVRSCRGVYSVYLATVAILIAAACIVIPHQAFHFSLPPLALLPLRSLGSDPSTRRSVVLNLHVDHGDVERRKQYSN